MYSKEATKHLQKLTSAVMKKLRSGSISKKEIKHFRNVLRFHDYRYYILNDPLISDFEYDQLFKALQKLEEENPGLVTADSPTRRISTGLTKDFPAIQHLVPMLSLDNSYNGKDLIDFDRRARELTGKDKIEYCAEPKFDGAGISLIYEHDLLVRAATRGDGFTGDDITNNIRQIRSVPLSAKFSAYGVKQIEIRGEVLINKKSFKRKNEQLMQQGLPTFANPRNASAGSLRLKDPSEVKKRNLEAFVYHVSFFATLPGKKAATQLSRHSTSMDMLWDLGFRSPKKEKKVVKGIEGVIKYCNEYEEKRERLPYEIDGMVVKVDDLLLQDQLGMTSHHPRWAIAFKYKPRQATTKLVGVEFQVGRTGAVTPVAKLAPVAIAGVTVNSVSIHNEDYINEKDLRIGDSVLIERAGDVIPQIVKSLPAARTGKEKKIHFPVFCPVCRSKLSREKEEAVWRCTNIECPAQALERIRHFTSKDAMDIRGFGDATIRKFFDLGLLTNIPGIYKLNYKRIAMFEGFGEKAIGNLKAAVNHSKNQPLHRLIYALGIRFVGQITAKTLANSVKHLLEFQHYSLEDFQNLEDIGPKVGRCIYQFFRNKENIRMIRQLEQLGVRVTSEKKYRAKDGNLTGLTFLFTGALSTLKRSDAEAMVEKKGGRVLNGVGPKLNYLVAGDDAGSKLEKARKNNSVKIISEDEFLQIVGKGQR